jgi:riboflavin kinase/FMN adenylyltransferase
MAADTQGVITDERVRAEISAFNLDGAAELLGHPYTMIGPVEHGKGLGRTAKMPTANIGFDKRKLIPPHWDLRDPHPDRREAFRGLTIIGTRPTVDNFPYVTIETYLLDFSRDIYGRTIHLEIRAYVREIRKFRDLFEAKEQVDRDIERVREYLMRIR